MKKSIKYNDNKDKINTAIRVSTGNQEHIIFGHLLASYPQGLFIQPGTIYHAGDLGRLIPTASIVYADFYKKDMNLPPASNIKVSMKLKGGYIFGDYAVLAMTDQGIYIGNKLLSDEIESVKFVPFSAMIYCNFSIIDESVFIDLESLDDPDDPDTTADPAPENEATVL
jgi:hypothetical protein